MKSTKRKRRRHRREHEQGPLRKLVVSFERNGIKLEQLVCGHEVPAGPPRQTETPGKIYRHCSVCPKPELEAWARKE